VDAPSSGPPRRPLSLWKVWAVIFVLFAIAFAVAWILVKGSVRRAEERRRSASGALSSSRTMGWPTIEKTRVTA